MCRPASSHPFSKVFEEERELTVMLLVDISASNLFGTVNARKRDLATEIAAVLAFFNPSTTEIDRRYFYSDRWNHIPPKEAACPVYRS